jgi:hypothetical protein
MSREHVLVLALCLAAPLALLGLGQALRPDPRGWGTHEQLGFRPCFPMARWNVPCPGCGVTTSLAYLARGELGSSVRTQPLGLLGVLGASAGALWSWRRHRQGRDLARELAHLTWARALRAAGGVLFLAWLYKLTVTRAWL